MSIIRLARLTAITLAAASCSLVCLAGEGRSITSVNGSVNSSPGENYDTLSAVNGDVRVARGASAEDAHTVNGDVTVDVNASVGQARTVNGSLELRDAAKVIREASTVNGSIELGRQARVGGNVSTVSGDIEIDGGEVVGRVQTRNGDIELRGGGRVSGGIHVKKKSDRDWGWGSDADNRPVRVRICATCVVDGELRFDRPVDLVVEPGARIGPVIGSQVTRR